MFRLWTSKNQNVGPAVSVRERSDISVESLPRLDSYQRIMTWLSNDEYERQNVSYILEDESEDCSGEHLSKELKDGGKSCHPKKFFRLQNLFNNLKNKIDDSYISTTTYI